MTDLSNQQLDRKYEVIVVDDESEDETSQKVEDFINNKGSHVKLIRQHSNGNTGITPKKRALNAGVEASKGNIIVTTDGDCRAPDTWLSSIANQFQDEGVHFVSGPVTYKQPTNVFESLQTLEFASLIGVGASSIQLGYPNICNGANLAFRKDSFKKLNGYNGNGHLASGDDEFLLQKFALQNPKGIHFLKDRGAVITTNAKRSLSEFYHQRKRWTSKLKHHKEWHIKLLSAAAFIVNFTLITAFLLATLSMFNWAWLGALLITKYVFEGIFVSKIMTFFDRKMRWFDFLLLELIHPFYIVILGLFTNFGTFKWKGRTYHE